MTGREDFGEYQCCAMNAYGQVCSKVRARQTLPPVSVTRTVATSRVTSTLLPEGLNESVVVVDGGDDKRRHYLIKSKQFLHLESAGIRKRPVFAWLVVVGMCAGLAV